MFFIAPLNTSYKVTSISISFGFPLRGPDAFFDPPENRSNNPPKPPPPGGPPFFTPYSP